MTTRTSHTWQSVPGNFDTLHLDRAVFHSDNAMGIPAMARTPADRIPEWLAPYGQRIHSKEPPDEGAVHFFLDDYRFESVWTRPARAVQKLHSFTMALTPDFSLYRDWPLAAQIWNTYRNRWCGCLWQRAGLTVIPTISWGTAVSYNFCFLGVPKQSVVAVATVGVNLKEPLHYQLFLDGFSEMVKRLNPAIVLVYGDPPAACYDMVKIKPYPTRWFEIRKARALAKGV
jgi:hypothetical protein